jgi:hypothetical protein
MSHVGPHHHHHDESHHQVASTLCLVIWPKKTIQFYSHHFGSLYPALPHPLVPIFWEEHFQPRCGCGGNKSRTRSVAPRMQLPSNFDSLCNVMRRTYGASIPLSKNCTAVNRFLALVSCCLQPAVPLSKTGTPLLPVRSADPPACGIKPINSISPYSTHLTRRAGPLTHASEGFP